MQYRALYKLACGVSLSLLLASPAMAQVPAAQTGSASAGRASEQLPTAHLTPREVPLIEVKDIRTQSAPEGAEDIKFILNSLDLDSLVSYNEADLESFYADKMGAEVSLAEIYDVAAALTRKYRNDGYVLTQVVVPPQTIDGGNVTLQVVEGFVDQVIVRGAQSGKSLNLIKAYAEQIKTDGSAVNIGQLERAMLLISDLPGLSARGILNTSETTPGAVDMIIEVAERDRYDGTIGIDNHGTRYLGPVQLSAAVSVNSAMGYNERITAQFVTAPENMDPELLFYALAYEQPVFNHGTRILFNTSGTDTDPGYDLRQFDVEGQERHFGLGLSHPFIRSRAVNLTGRMNFDYNNIDSKNNVETTRKDRVRALRIGGSFEYLGTWAGTSYNIFDLTVSRGLNIFGANSEKDTNISRAAADPDFTKATFEMQRLQRLAPSINLLFAGRGQIASNALYSSEEFGVGGASYGRGFDSSEIIGDDGLAGKVEIQWNDPIDLKMPIDSYQMYGFYDAGTIWNKDATTSATKTDTVTSAGVGVRGDVAENTNFGLSVAFPLNRDVQTKGDDDPTVYFSLYHDF